MEKLLEKLNKNSAQLNVLKKKKENLETQIHDLEEKIRRQQRQYFILEKKALRGVERQLNDDLDEVLIGKPVNSEDPVSFE
jgi:peptidoglycan hydrolase CwlO-like protein